MDCHDPFTPTSLFGPNHSIRSHPVVCMNNVKRCSHVIFNMEQSIYKRSTHFVYIINQIRPCAVRNPMIMDTVNTVVLPVVMPAHSGKYMYFMTFSFKCCGQFCDMHSDPAQSDGMKSFP